MKLSAAICAALLLGSVLGSCGSVSLWPLGGEAGQERSRKPANATEFLCGDGRAFYVRYQDEGASAWVILPEREVRLDKSGAATGGRYGRGDTSLEINAGEATLLDGAVSYLACKTPAQ